jgi:cytochrome c biogenesis protein CcmG, thiol:disulfide interchange protein DsbE
MAEQPSIVDAALPRAVVPENRLARRRLLLALPAIGFAGLAGLLASGLGRDSSLLPSTLIGRRAPKFDLPPVQGRTLGLGS